MRRLGHRLRAQLAAVPRAELIAVGAAMALGTLAVLVYVLATRPNSLAGDQQVYDQYGVFFSQGKWWWSSAPFGIPHASAVKAPLYPLWVGLWYSLLGASTTKLLIVQSLLAAVTVALTWGLARRLFGARAAIASAFGVAIFPLVWEWFGLVYSEALAIPLVTLTLLLFLERAPTARLALVLGAVLGVGLLLRPTSVFLFAGVAAAWVIASGWRRGLGLTSLALAVAVLVIAPWTIRNAIVADGFVPISVQEAAAYGTFNDVSANNPRFPYAWQPAPTPEARDILDGPPVSDAKLRSELSDLGLDYIGDHPASLFEAFYWNGLSRFWDIRRPGNATSEVAFEGRSKAVTTAGLILYYALLPLALFGLWRHRARRSLVVPVLVSALAASIVFTVASGTRYRAPLEPLIVVLAVSAFVPPAGPIPTRSSPAA